MATLALAAVGSAIGGAAITGTFLGLSGSAIGWTVGSLIGNALFGPELPDQIGPRLDSLKVTSSTYGAPINLVYGTMRVPGNIIWAADLIETTHSQESGGKGGPSSTSTSYTYAADFAVGLCKGEITGIRKIWADSILVYDVSDTANAETVIASNQFADTITIYTGSETQTASPLIEAYEGTGNVPAFRGLARIDFENFQLERFGRRIPNITCEVINDGSTTSAKEITTWTLENESSLWYVIDGYENGIISMSEIKTDASAPPGQLSTYDVNGNLIDRYDHQTEDKCTASSVKRYGDTSNAPKYIYRWKYLNCGNATGILDDRNNASYFSYHTTSWQYSDISAENDGENAICIDGVVYAMWEGSGNSFWLNKHINGGNPLIQWYLALPSTSRFHLTYDEAQEKIYLRCNSCTTANEEKLYRFDKNLVLEKTWPESEASNLFNRNVEVHNGIGYSVREDTDPHTLKVYELDDTALTITETDSINITNSGFAGGYNVTLRYLENNIIAHRKGLVYLGDTLGTGTTTLSSIVSDICLKSGLVASDIDVTSLTDNVDGYVVNTLSNGRNMIEPLRQAFHFDAVESDYKLKFVKRS